MSNPSASIPKKNFLIRFTYDFYCQGYEDAVETLLVRARTYSEGCKKIKTGYLNARDFQNMTIE